MMASSLVHANANAQPSPTTSAAESFFFLLPQLLWISGASDSLFVTSAPAGVWLHYTLSWWWGWRSALILARYGVLCILAPLLGSKTGLGRCI